jgi:hypothetical protein
MNRNKSWAAWLYPLWYAPFKLRLADWTRELQTYMRE